jgi:hypothetical protein
LFGQNLLLILKIPLACFSHTDLHSPPWLTPHYSMQYSESSSVCPSFLFFHSNCSWLKFAFTDLTIVHLLFYLTVLLLPETEDTNDLKWKWKRTYHYSNGSWEIKELKWYVVRTFINVKFCPSTIMKK